MPHAFVFALLAALGLVAVAIHLHLRHRKNKAMSNQALDDLKAQVASITDARLALIASYQGLAAKYAVLLANQANQVDPADLVAMTTALHNDATAMADAVLANTPAAPAPAPASPPADQSPAPPAAPPAAPEAVPAS